MPAFSILFLLSSLLCTVYGTKPNYCIPSDENCWPTISEINDFSNSLDGQMVQPSDGTAYDVYVNMTRDTLYTAYPAFVAVCSSAQDIQKAVTFAREHQIQISICSTGHSYSGRNVANNSIQINLSKMQHYEVSADKNSITVETGLQWAQIYQIADKVNRIIVGGSDPTVGPGGYSLGGGHSPLSPHYGLSSDFTLEYYMVDAQSNIVHVYNTSGVNQTIDDLFWSLKGGGGSTFGVIVNITFALHTPDPIEESIFTQVVCTYYWYQHPLRREGYIGDLVLKNLFSLMQQDKFDANWGGYVVNEYDTAFIISWLYYGNATVATQQGAYLNTLYAPYNSTNNCQFHYFNTFWEYESTVPADGGGNQYVSNSLIPKQNLTDSYAELVSSFLNSSNLAQGFITGICVVLQGGKVNSFADDYTAVAPAFRQNWLEMALGTYWGDTGNQTIYNNAVGLLNKFEPELRSYGLGIYGNEENPICVDCNWKQQIWGDHYDRLLSVKQKWDPNQVFWCNHCVGDE